MITSNNPHEFSPHQTKQNKTNEFLWYFSIPPPPTRNFEKKTPMISGKAKERGRVWFTIGFGFSFWWFLGGIRLESRFGGCFFGREAFWLVAFNSGGKCWYWVGRNCQRVCNWYNIYIYSSYNLNANYAGNMYMHDSLLIYLHFTPSSAKSGHVLWKPLTVLGFLYMFLHAFT